MPVELSPMVEDYLQVIWKAQEWSDESIASSSIASIIGVAPSTVSGNLKKLARDGLIDYAPYGSITLSVSGRKEAIALVRRHRIIETYLVEHLDFTWDEVHAEADLLEHSVSARLLDRLDRVLGYPSEDPHGDPIPRPDGSVDRPPAVQLSTLGVGTVGHIARISDAESEILRYLMDRGLRIGARVTVTDRYDKVGSIAVRVNDDAVTELSAPAADAMWIIAASRSSQGS